MYLRVETEFYQKKKKKKEKELRHRGHLAGGVVTESHGERANGGFGFVMAEFGSKWRSMKSIAIVVFLNYFLAFGGVGSADGSMKHDASTLINATKDASPNYFLGAATQFLWQQPHETVYNDQRVWPVSWFIFNLIYLLKAF